MIVLGIETSTARSSVALLGDGLTLAHEAHTDARGHGAFLAPALHRCLAAAPAIDGRARIDAVAVGTGPGLYTGLRVGMATASAFASARRIPIVGVGGMDALAHACAADGGCGDGYVVTTSDARRGQVFWAVHEHGPSGVARIDGPRVGSRAELDAALVALAERATVTLVGEVGADEVRRPDAVDTAQLALPLLASTPADRLNAAALEVVYLRDADVRIGWAERGGTRDGTPDGADAA